MGSVSSEFDRKPKWHGPLRLPYFAISGSVSNIFCRLAWER